MNQERWRKIEALLQENPTVSVRQLQQIYPDVTPMTLRRDLMHLEAMGKLQRIRGGARLADTAQTNYEKLYSQREAEHYDKKSRIARLALPYLGNRGSLYLDSGSTIMCLAAVLPAQKYSVITSGPNIAIALSMRPGVSVNLVGGELNPNNLTVSGIQSLRFIEHLNIDTALIVPSGFTLDGGFSCGNSAEAELKRAVLEKARRRIILMDLSKYGCDMPFTFAHLQNVEVVITDASPPADMLAAGEAHQVTFVYE